MGDMGELFNAWREHKKAVKADRLATAEKHFDARCDAMPGWTRHTQWHWSRTLLSERFDYWPSTGKWIWRGRKYHGTPYDTANFIAKREPDDLHAKQTEVSP